ncbi:LysM peptidoglycan-binding domain-containing protein [Gemmobacter denitrificans]|uniref:LysM peptidoglycan-binding domain-containing protein n=1 Tax=Gemmobacter denitrificans TaxID=3123040 RepID=A0ABU8BZV6_9RHOB
MKVGLIYLGIVGSLVAVITGVPWVTLLKDVPDPLAGVIPPPVTAPAPQEPPAPVFTGVMAALEEPAPEVTRAAAPAPDALEATQTDDATAAAAALAALVVAGTGLADPVEPEPVAAPAAEQPVAAQVAAPAPQPQAGDIDQTTAAILAALTGTAPESGAAVAAADPALQAMSVAALNGLANAKPAPTLEGLVAQALREGQSDAYIDALVNEAAGRKEIAVPGALVTAEGKVDTAVLLADLVGKAQDAAGQPRSAPREVVTGGDGVEVHTVAQADGSSQQFRFYTVARGDSLGAIAEKFYGDAGYYLAIFEANRAILSTPDALNAGQRLVIPGISQL